MDYQEAIYCMKVMAEEEVCEECNYYYRCDHYKQADMARIAISAMQELQELHNQGFSLERLKNIDFRKEVIERINYDAYMSLMDELEEYRELGTLEELKKLKECELSGIELAEIACSLNLLKDYQQIGTLEEVREAVEKQKRKKPCASNRCYVCPHCGLVASLKIKHNYCDACGQHIDWSEEE